jgi:hypothetical protein
VRPNLDWLLRQRLFQVEKKDYTWFFTFDGGGSVNIDSAWRLISSNGIIVTSEDHGHPFGLPEPVDAGKRVIDAAQNTRVSTYLCDKPTSDLIILFENGIQIQFLNMSCGYESWTAWNNDTQVICLGGGELASFNHKQK